MHIHVTDLDEPNDHGDHLFEWIHKQKQQAWYKSQNASTMQHRDD